MNKIDFKLIIQDQKKKFKTKIKKDKKNILQSIQKELLVFFKKFYWKNFFSIKYILLTILHFIKKKKIKKNTISILLPTRCRFFKFKRFLDSLIKKTNYKHRIETLVFLDDDEP